MKTLAFNGTTKIIVDLSAHLKFNVNMSVLILNTLGFISITIQPKLIKNVSSIFYHFYYLSFQNVVLSRSVLKFVVK